MKIRASRGTDWQRVIQIWRDAVDATHDFLTPEDRLAIDREVQECLPFELLQLAVDENDRAIAFMLVSGSSMEALFVDPDYHGQGIGRALVSHALAGNAAVNEQNARAVGFYEHLGFVRTGRSECDDEGRPYPLIRMKLANRSE